jgi:hypothetical protein
MLEDAVKRSLEFWRIVIAGLTYQKLNETVQARSQFDKIIDLDPEITIRRASPASLEQPVSP